MELTAAKRVVLLLPLLLTTTTVPLCGGQTANLTLIEIAPCNGTVVQTVSRFMSDVFAVKANLGACPPNDTSLMANGRLVSPTFLLARGKRKPLFIFFLLPAVL